MLGSVNVCARGLGEVAYGAEVGALAICGYGLLYPSWGRNSELASPYPELGISFNTIPLGTPRFCRCGGGVPFLDGLSGVRDL